MNDRLLGTKVARFAVAGAVVVLLAASHAAAQSCGHYVKVGGYRGPQAEPITPAHGSGPQAMPPAPGEAPPAGPPPCSGPNCSGLPDSAPPPAAPQDPGPSSFKFLGLASEADADAPPGASWLDAGLLTDERDRPERIFRPPR